MRIFWTLLLAYVMGFFTAIPIGATQIEIAKRSLNNQLWPALMVVLGSVSSDVMYGFVAFFGVAPFLRGQAAIAVFELAGAVVLCILAFLTFRQWTSRHISGIGRSFLRSTNLSFLTGFSLAVTNPMMIFWWLIGARIVKDLGLVDTFTPGISTSFLIFGGLGLASYLTTLAKVLHWAKKFVSERFMRRINLVLGVVLVILASYFFMSSIRTLLR